MRQQCFIYRKCNIIYKCTYICLFLTLMTNSFNQSISKKRRWGKYQNRLVEDENEAIDVVTFKEISTDTPRGQVTKRVEVPLRPKIQMVTNNLNNIRESRSSPLFDNNASIPFDTYMDDEDINEESKIRLFTHFIDQNH